MSLFYFPRHTESRVSEGWKLNEIEKANNNIVLLSLRSFRRESDSVVSITWHSLAKIIVLFTVFIRNSSFLKWWLVSVYAINLYSNIISIVPLIPTLGTRWRQMPKFTPRPPYPRKRIPVPNEWKFAWFTKAELEVWGKRKCLVPTGIQTPDRPARILVTMSTTLPRFLHNEFLQIIFLPCKTGQTHGI